MRKMSGILAADLYRAPGSQLRSFFVLTGQNKCSTIWYPPGWAGRQPGFNDTANLDEDAMGPVAVTRKELTAADEAGISTLVKKEVS